MMCRRGLTLIELLVALTITGLVMGAGYGALSVMVDHRARVMTATDVVAGAAARRRVLTNWLRGTRLTIEEDAKFEGLHGVEAGSQDDALTFLTNASTPLGVSETIVRIYIDRDERTPERGLTAILMGRRGSPSRRVAIDPRATSLEIRYLSGAFGKRAWLDSWVSATVLPTAVRLTLSSAQPDSLPSLLRQPIVVPLGNVQ